MPSCTPLIVPHKTGRAIVFLLAMISIVHACGMGFGTALAQSPSKQSAPAQKAAPSTRSGGSTQPGEIGTGTKALPLPVLEMRDTILAAAKSGRLDDLKIAVELNEMKPVFGDEPVGDPIAFVKKNSADGTGQDVLAAIGAILDGDHAVLPLGRDIENNRIYVWPSFAETGITNLPPEREAALAGLVTAEQLKTMRDAGRYTHWRLGIGADGTWHFLRK